MPKADAVSSREAIITGKPPRIKDVVSLPVKRVQVEVEVITRSYKVNQRPQQIEKASIRQETKHVDVDRNRERIIKPTLQTLQPLTDRQHISGSMTIDDADGVITVNTSKSPVTVILRPLTEDSSQGVTITKTSKDDNGVTLLCKDTRIDHRYDMKVFGIKGTTNTVHMYHTKGVWFTR